MSIYNHKCNLCSLSLDALTVCMAAQKGKKKALILGEAPGANEDKKGTPFIGRSGQILDAALKAGGCARADFWVSNIVKCRPPENRTPTWEEVEACSTYLEKEIASIKPTTILVVGGVAIAAVLRYGVSVGKVRGEWIHRWKADVMPTYHPAYTIYDSTARDAFFKDVALFCQRVKGAKSGNRTSRDKSGKS